MKITAKKNKNGKWVMVAEDGVLPQGGKEHRSRFSVYRHCKAMYPANSVWSGRKVHRGYYIDAS